MFSIHIFFVIVATVVLVIFAEIQNLRKITWVLIVGCIGYIILNIEPNFAEKDVEITPIATTTVTEREIIQEISENESEVIEEKNTIISEPVIAANDTIDIMDDEPDILTMSVNYIDIAKDVVDREPVDTAHLFLSDIEHLYCYTSVNNPFDNNIVVHHWYSNNIEYFNYPIEIGNSDNWRCWSMITIRPQLAGEWIVSATDTLGNILAQTEFTILETEE